jgi:urea carboxylase
MADYLVSAEITGSVWKTLIRPGDVVALDDPLLIIESMKMEIPVLAPQAGTVRELNVKEGDPVSEGDTLLTLDV